MTRWLIRLAFPALGLLLVLIIFGVNVPDTMPDTPEEVSEPATMPSFETLVPAPVAPEGPDIVFKWQDAEGSWHYADQPPEEGAWHTLAIEPGQDAQPMAPTSPETSGEPLNAPYTAPFSLAPRLSDTDS